MTRRPWVEVQKIWVEVQKIYVDDLSKSKLRLLEIVDVVDDK
jgi:hypothetical protein